MDSDTLQDLKQFITATVSQQLAQQTEELNERFDEHDKKFETIDKRFEMMDKRLDDHEEKLDEILNAVGASFQDSDRTLHEHDVRITRLERKLAA